MLLRTLLLAAVLGFAVLPVLAQEPPPPSPEPEEGAPAPEPAPTDAAPAPQAAPVPEAAAAAPEAAAKPSFWRRLWPRQDEAAAAPSAEAAAAPAAAPVVPPPPLPRRLVVVQERLRASRVAKDVTGLLFLDLVDSGAASEAHLNEFGIWLSGQGILEPAEEYFRASLELDPTNPEVWNNLGMIQLRLAQNGAKSSFQRAIALEPTHAAAHYNLGLFLDRAGEYDAAVEEYTRALLLDPRLGDPSYNPQAVHNDRLLVVRLGLYERKAKTIGLPMSPAPPKK